MRPPDDPHLPPPREPGPLGTWIANILGPPVLFCIAGMFGCLGGVCLTSVFCALDELSAAAALVVCLIVTVYVFMWVRDVGLMGRIRSFAAIFSVMTPLAEFYDGHSRMDVVKLWVALFLFPGAVSGMKKTKIQRTGDGWMYDLLAVYFFMNSAILFLGSICMAVSLLFGVEGDIFCWKFVTTQNFPL